MPESIVIAGAGHASGQAIASLRQKGYSGNITLIGEESWVPYQRPPLSKKYLAGELSEERLFFKPERYYPEHGVSLRLSKRVTDIDRDARHVQLEGGETIGYDQLLLTLGSHVRRIKVPGSNLAGIHYLRTIDDVRAMQTDFGPGKRLIVVGGGYIGLEVAAVAASMDMRVTVLEAEDRAMKRVTAPEVSDFFHELHTTAGVDLRFGASVEYFEGQDRVAEVVCADDQRFEADVVLVGIGILPRMDIAVEAGLECDDGILVNEFCETSDPAIFAAGDCTRHPNSILGRQLRLESVHNALEQAKTAATSMCGERVAYAQVPWFWSDQYDVKLQIVGLSQGYNHLVLRGEPAEKSFAAFYLDGDLLLAVDAINSPREFMLAKKLIAGGARFEPEKLGDPSVPFKALAEEALQKIRPS